MFEIWDFMSEMWDLMSEICRMEDCEELLQ